MDMVLLLRSELAGKYESRIAQEYFRVEESRMLCRDALVIGRYSVLPMYHELDRDLRLVGSRLINTVQQHAWISSFEYYQQLQAFTPATWDDTNIHACRHAGPFVVKGKMSSRKWQWKHQMFAKTKRAALELGKRLKEDSQIGEQGIVYRQYVPLKTYELGVNGLPHTNEWRFFFLKEKLLSVGYYWSAADCLAQARLDPQAIDLAHRIAEIAARHATFYVLDLAETQTGEWILIEMNDGQTSGTSENDLDELYGKLKRYTMEWLSI
jgi:hypothetical protein